MKINLIASVSQNNVIGFEGKTPWYINEDLQQFKAITMGHPVVMGRKTYESIGHPLEGRLNFVVSSGGAIPGCVVIKDPKTILDLTFDEIFIIGGQQLYEEFFPIADTLYITHIFGDFDGDAIFPDINLSQWEEVSYVPGKYNENVVTEPWGFSKFERRSY